MTAIKITAVLSLLALAACGADGEPIRPEPKTQATGIKISGTARVGISVSRSGVQPSAAVRLHWGPVVPTLEL